MAIKVSSRVLISKLMSLPVVVMYKDGDGGCPVAAFESMPLAEEYVYGLDYRESYYIYVED